MFESLFGFNGILNKQKRLEKERLERERKERDYQETMARARREEDERRARESYV